MLSIFNEIITTLFGVYATIVLLRFIFQLVKADFYNPVSQGIVKITSPILVPLRRIIPGFWGLDIASLLLAYAIYLASLVLVVLISGGNPLSNIEIIALYALLKLLTTTMNVFTFALLAGIVLSFVAPMSRHPGAILANQIADPMMAPFRKLIPPFGGIDISPIFVFLTLSVVTKALAIFAGKFGIPLTTMWLFIFVG